MENPGDANQSFENGRGRISTRVALSETAQSRKEVWDVAVDLRTSSETFLSWHAEELSAENNKALLIPEGFAHGFQVLEKESELLYLHSEQYAPQLEDGLSPMDPRLSIPWPLPIAEMSDRDRGFPLLTDKYKGISL